MLDKYNAFQEAMVGSAIGSIAQLNERNLRLVKAFLDNQLKITEEERAESQDSPSFIMETYKIEKNIPMENKQGKVKFTAECMKVGDSVLMESYPKAVSLANALRALNKLPKFAIQPNGKVRVWYKEPKV